MQITLPDINHILAEISELEFSYEGRTQRIHMWVDEHRENIRKNTQLAQKNSDETDIEVLLHFLRDMLVRAMRGEKGERVFDELRQRIKNKSDLHEANYIKALTKAKYRWGAKTGSEVISHIVDYFGNELNWNWQAYFLAAEQQRDTDFIDDRLLKIKHIGFKVRDLALSNFNPYYAAFDLHLTRVPTRIGLLNYGFDLLHEDAIEMGNNPSNEKHYLFLHRLFRKLSLLTEERFLAADFDRLFWSFGRSVCKAKPKCAYCPINESCLTGKYRMRR